MEFFEMQTPEQSITARLKALRTSLGLTQAQMAARLGYRSYRSWQEFESGNRTPTFDVLDALFKNGFSVDWILCGQGPMLNADRGVGIDHQLLVDALRDVKEETVLQKVSLSPEKEADIVAEIYLDALEEQASAAPEAPLEVNHQNVVRFVRFSK